jgi:hypothetical protein
MKTKLIILAASITIASGSASYHLSTQPQPTESQKNLITILNNVTISGTTALFSLLNDEDKNP